MYLKGEPVAADVGRRDGSRTEPTKDVEVARRDTNPTRVLCSAIHADDQWCRWVVRWFRTSAYRSMAPSYQTDLAAVAAHGYSAWRRLLARDTVLCAILLTTLVALARRHGWRPAVAAAAVVVLLALTIGLVARFDARWSTVWTWLRTRYRNNTRNTQHEAALLLLMLALGAGLVLTWPAMMSGLRVAAVGGLAGWTVAAVDSFVATVRARRVRDSSLRMRDLAAPPPRWLTDRIAPFERPDAMNLYIYHGSLRFYDTLIGSGQFVDEWQVSVDASQGKLRRDGKRETPMPVDVVGIHEALRISAGMARIPGLWCGYRIYADGRHVRGGPWLGGRQYGPPATRVSRRELLGGLGRADALRRTYMCIQIPSWNGDLIVTLFLRAELSAGILYLYSKVYVLPGIEEPSTVVTLPRRAPETLGRALLTATRRFVPLLLRSPDRCAVALLLPVLRWVSREVERYRIRRGPEFDFGALESLRERLVWGQRLHFNARDDLLRNLYVLESHLAKVLKDHLEALNVDASAIEKTMTAIVLAQQNTFNNVRNVTFGQNSRAGDTIKIVEPMAGTTSTGVQTAGGPFAASTVAAASATTIAGATATGSSTAGS